VCGPARPRAEPHILRGHERRRQHGRCLGAGESTRTFTITVLEDASPEGNEAVTLTLAAPGGGGALGFPIAVTLYVVVDD
jgi:hypothetical protein